MPTFVSPNCYTCPVRQVHAFCDLPPEAQDFLDDNSISMAYPRAAILLREGERPNAISRSAQAG